MVLGTLSLLHLPDRGARGSPDLLDPDILSEKTLEEMKASRSEISRRWGIATALQPADFVEALKAIRGPR